MGILALAMVIGSLSATATLVAGHSLVVAFAVYSGFGALSLVLTALIIATACAFRARKGDFPQTDITAFN
jgi:hypothetical protein